MPFFRRLKLLFNNIPTRAEYPKNKFPAWEFISQPDGYVLARVYTNPPQEELFSSQAKASKWVHTVMAVVKEAR